MPCNYEISYPAVVIKVESSLDDALYRYVRLRDEGTDTKVSIHSCTNAALWNGSAVTGMRAGGSTPRPTGAAPTRGPTAEGRGCFQARRN